MAPGKNKGRKTRRRASLGRLLILVSAVALIMGGCVAVYFAWFMTAFRPIPYEEAFPVPSELSDQIARTNLALYECLYRGMVPESNVLFLSVEPRQERGQEWEFTEVMVRLPDPAKTRDLEGAISAELSRLGHEIQHRNVMSREGDTVIDLFVRGHFTHRIRMAGEGREQGIKAERLPLISIIIDDLGYDLHLARSLIEMDVPLTLSIIPTAPHAVAVARAAAERGRELILHLPMEPKGYPQVNPGPGALLSQRKEKVIATIVEDHLDSIPGVRGINNHMGSRFTELEEPMGVVFRELKKRSLFYIDSKTTEASVALAVGKKTGVPVGTRSIFLDNQLSPTAMKVQTERLIGMARSSGGAIAIGHPHKETLQYLKESVDRIKQNGKIVPVSEILHQQSGAALSARTRDLRHTGRNNVDSPSVANQK